ncbi:CCA tRNA nucleotidyltransferase [Macrococcus epidermidis]|uniref:CCA tRNA nucleotidyltransferase n=1 Tax=Macrococcus epidermidis TaxID=1902580 RepID=UPI0020B7BF52|nr:CCA tRNA nucleotidyltransferase [Macrococcus epidermidis]UTH15179.1 CCA tRNA nucleotidyltransferase [Macrococcus epidermidis]
MKLELTYLNHTTQTLIIAANEVIEELKLHGYEAYIVGGAVRNLLLKKEVNDIDITTNCLPENIIKIFSKTVPIGIEHGTVIVLWQDFQFEVTTFRVDGEYIDHRRPEQVQFVTDLKSDLERRDFTINALALSETHEIIDYFDGQKDLKNKEIRAVGHAAHRFEEDALRMMRAIRFQSVLNFNIEENTLLAIDELAATIALVSIERIVVELKKLLMGKGVHQALQIFYKTMHRYLPFFRDIRGNTTTYQLQSPAEFTVYIAYIIYCELKIDQDLTSKISDFKLSNQEKKKIKDCVLIFDYFNHPEMSLKAFVYRFDIDLIQNVYHFILNEKVVIDNLVDITSIQKAKLQLTIQTRDELQIDGNVLMTYLNKKPGPWLKSMLNNIELAVIEGRLSNRQEKILEWAKNHV